MEKKENRRKKKQAGPELYRAQFKLVEVLVKLKLANLIFELNIFDEL